jgi:23S rRNA (guanosine2251-2'-O)-methyltransferase
MSAAPRSGGRRTRGGGRNQGSGRGKTAQPKGHNGKGAEPKGRRQAGPGRGRSSSPPLGRSQGTARPPRTKLVPTRAARSRLGATRSQAVGRTGKLGDQPAKRDGKGLGGQQIEGRQAARELLIAGHRRVQEIWLSSELAGDDGVADIAELARVGRVPVAYVAKAKLEARARSEAPQGVIAFAAELAEADLDDLLRGRRGHRPFLVAVDGVTDPGNLGAILRNCDGAGVDGVLLRRHRAVHVTPTVAKAAAGAVEHVPIALVGGLPAALTRLRGAGIWVVGLDDAADRSLFDIGDLATDGICIVLGAEGAGLSRLVRERCDAIVSIPMLGRIRSLNVSAAAALATYEVARHRAP